MPPGLAASSCNTDTSVQCHQSSITFGTLSNPKFHWFDGLKHVTDKELSELAIQSRSATAAIFAELSDRSKPWHDGTLEDYRKKLLESAELTNRKGLTEEYETCLDDLSAYLADPSDARNEVKVARQFLWLVSRVIGWSYALLLFCALGKNRLEKLDEDQRTKLVVHIVQHRDSLFCPIFQDKAAYYNLDQIYIKVDPPLTRGCKKRKRESSKEIAASGTAPAVASSGNVTAFHFNTDSHRRKKATHSYPIAPETRCLDTGGNRRQNVTFVNIIQEGRAVVNNCRSLAGRSVDGSDQDLERDLAPHNPSHPPGPRANPHSPPPSKIRQRLRSSTSLPSQEHKSSLSNSKTGNYDDKIANSTVLGNDIDCGAVVKPQNQVAAFNQPLPKPHNRLQHSNRSLVSGAVFNGAGSRPIVREDGTHDFDNTASTPSTTESQQSPTSNRINYEVVEQPVVSTQDVNQPYNLQSGTNRSVQGMSSRLLMQERQQQSQEFVPCFTKDARLISTASISAAPFAENEFVSIPNCNDVQGFFSDRSRVMHSPSPPQVLLVAEELYHNIKVYFEDSCQNMIFDDHGALLNLNGAELCNDLCNEFDSYCFTATMLKGRELHVEFRHALSKASALVEQILRAEHPRTLACFLEVFIHFIQTGLPQVASILRDFIKKMSEKVIRGGHPWGQICRLLGELDSEPLDMAMAQLWKCTTDTFESELGASSRLAVSVRLDYIKRVYGFKEYLEEERLLRDLLAQFHGIPRAPTPRVMLNLAHNLNRQRRHDEAEKMALEVFSLLQLNEIYTKKIAERIECMKIVSHSQFKQGKNLLAERNIREAIKMIVDQWGIQHSWVVEFMNVLEGWLRDWGRDEDANALRGEIGRLIRKDIIDEQLDGIQGLLCQDNIGEAWNKIHPAGRN